MYKNEEFKQLASSNGGTLRLICRILFGFGVFVGGFALALMAVKPGMFDRFMESPVSIAILIFAYASALLAGLVLLRDYLGKRKSSR